MIECPECKSNDCIIIEEDMIHHKNGMDRYGREIKYPEPEWRIWECQSCSHQWKLEEKDFG